LSTPILSIKRQSSGLPDQELSLLAAFAIVVIRLVHPVARVDEVPIHLIEMLQVFVLVGERRQSVPVREHELASVIPHALHRGRQIDQRSLPFVIASHAAGLEI